MTEIILSILAAVAEVLAIGSCGSSSSVFGGSKLDQEVRQFQLWLFFSVLFGAVLILGWISLV